MTSRLVTAGTALPLHTDRDQHGFDRDFQKLIMHHMEEPDSGL
jgi:hypothetical protein